MGINFHDWITLLSGILTTGGLIGGLALLLKVRPEAGQVVVTAAQGALIVQSGVIKDLRDELARVQEEAKKEIAELKTDLLKAQHEIDRLNNVIATMIVNQNRHDIEVRNLQNKK